MRTLQLFNYLYPMLTSIYFVLPGTARKGTILFCSSLLAVGMPLGQGIQSRRFADVQAVLPQAGLQTKLFLGLYGFQDDLNQGTNRPNIPLSGG